MIDPICPDCDGTGVINIFDSENDPYGDDGFPMQCMTCIDGDENDTETF